MGASPVAAAAPLVTADSPADRVGSLFDAHHDRLYRLARRLTDGADDAADLVQETFLRAARASGRVPAGHSHEEAWLVRVLINLQRDQWRRRRVRARVAPVMDSAPTVTAAHQEATLMARTLVWRALNRLPPRRRAVVVLHELEGVSLERIASLLGISGVTARWHLSRGRRELETILRSEKGDTR